MIGAQAGGRFPGRSPLGMVLDEHAGARLEPERLADAAAIGPQRARNRFRYDDHGIVVAFDIRERAAADDGNAEHIEVCGRHRLERHRCLAGAGIGERPTVNPEPGVDAYVWIKPPGESDGASEEIDNDEGKGFDEMCDPAYEGNPRNNFNMSGALPDAPISGHWFQAQFDELIANAWPPL